MPYGPSDCPVCGAPGCAAGCVCPACGWGPNEHSDFCPTVADDGIVDVPPTFLHTDREPVASFGDDPFEGLDLDSAYATLEEIER